MSTDFTGRRRWADWTSEAFAGLAREQLIAVLPIGAVEQHGPHLPMCVDTATVDGLVAETIRRLPAALPVLFLPTVAVGKSNEHAAYPGTLTYSAETLMRMWTELGECVARAGVRKLVFFNSHGGQDSLAHVVARDLRERRGLQVACVNWYDLGLPAGMFDADEMRFGIHAGELETSVMLQLHPELVKMERASNFGSTERELTAQYRHLSFLGGHGVLAWQTQDLNPWGACGNAAAGTAAKGQAVIEGVASQFVELLGEFHALAPKWLSDQTAW